MAEGHGHEGWLWPSIAYIVYSIVVIGGLIYCWFCARPLSGPPAIKNITTDTIEVNCNVRKTINKVRCSSCGARYEVEIYLDAKPTVSNEMLAKLDNRVHP